MKLPNIIIRVGVILIIYLLIVFLMDIFFKKINQKQKDIHTQFVLKLLRVVVSIICLGAIGLQFGETKDLTKALFACSSLFLAVAGFAAQM